MNKKGFVLMETIIVIVVISVALLTIFSSYNKILSKVKTENKYDTSEYIYATNYIKKYLVKNSRVSDTDIQNISENIIVTINDYYEDIFNIFGAKKVYILEITDEGHNESWDIKADNFSKFDAYMIDYLRKLDISKDTTLIIVEYKKPARNNKYKQLHYYDVNEESLNEGDKLYETYISSLEW